VSALPSLSSRSPSNRSLISLTLLTLGVLAGCTTLPRVDAVATAPLEWSVRRAMLQGTSNFELVGRLAVAVGEQGYSAGLRWQQRPETASIRLDGPLGLGGLEVQLFGTRIGLRGGDGRRLADDAARAELERVLGAPLPIGSLRYWLLGVPDPSAPAAERIENDGLTLAGFEQGGWQVRIAQRTPWRATAWSLPQRLELSREGLAFRLRLVVDQWREFRP